MKEISIRELARMVCDLPVNGNVYVKQHADSQLFGIACLNLFESDLIILSHFGGGFSAMFDTSVTNEEKEMCSWLQHAFEAGDNEKTVYLLDEKDVVGEPHNRENVTSETETTASLATDFTGRIHSLRKDIISNIISIFKENHLSEIDFKGMSTDMTDVLWCEGDGTWHDSPVTAVSLTEKGISLTVEDADEEISNTIDSEDFELAFTNPAWLAGIRDNILEAIDATKHLENDTQLSLFKEWNIYANNNDGDAPCYAGVSIRFKDDGSEGEVIISLTDHSEETADRVFHYARSLQELTELADTNPEATVQNFIILGLNSYSDTIENI
jgi:hypothetical protein